jgi:hypothetical protein
MLSKKGFGLELRSAGTAFHMLMTMRVGGRNNVGHPHMFTQALLRLEREPTGITFESTAQLYQGKRH